MIASQKFRFRNTNSIIPKSTDRVNELNKQWFDSNTAQVKYTIYPRFTVKKDWGTEEIMYPPSRSKIVSDLRELDDFVKTTTQPLVNSINKRATTEVVRNNSVAVPTIPGLDLNEALRRSRQPIRYNPRPTELQLATESILDGKNLEQYRRLFNGQDEISFSIGFKIMATHRMGRDAPSSTAKPSDPFKYIRNLKSRNLDTTEENGEYRVVPSRMRILKAKTFRMFLRKIRLMRAEAELDAPRESGDVNFVGLTPNRVILPRNLRDIKLNNVLLETPEEEEIPTKGGYCVLRMLTKRLKFKKQENGVSKVIKNEFVKMFGDEINDGININMLLGWNKKYGNRCSFHIYSPAMQLVEKYYAPRNTKVCSITCIVNNEHIYDITDCNLTASGDEIKTLGFNELPGKYTVYEWSDIEEEQDVWTKQNCIVICIDPGQQATEFAARLCKKNKISYVIENNSIITEKNINIIFEDNSYYDRREIAKELFEKYKVSSFDIEQHPRMNSVHLFKSLLFYHSGAAKVKSSFNESLYNTVKLYKTRAPVHCTKKNTGCWDMPKCYANTQKDFIDDISVFDELCYLEPFNGTLDFGMYLLEPYELGSIKESYVNLETKAIVEWLISKGLETSKIIGYVKPAYTVDKSYYKETINDILYPGCEQIKTRKQMLVIANGLNGKHTTDIKRCFTTISSDTLYATLLESNKIDSQTMKFNTCDGFYFATIEQSKPKLSNTMPLYIQTVSEAKLRLYKIIDELESCGYEIYGYNTDCIHTDYRPEYNLIDFEFTDAPDNFPEDYIRINDEIYSHKTEMRVVVIDAITEIAGQQLIWKETESIRPPETKAGVMRFGYDKPLTAKWNKFTREQDLSELDGYMVSGVAGSGKTYKITHESNNDLALALTHSVKNIIPNGKTIKSAFAKNIPSDKNIWVDECWMVGRKQLCELIRAHMQGCTIRLSGDWRQGLPMDGEFRNIIKNPVIADMCNNNLVELEYMEGLRYDKKSYDIITEFEKTQDINSLLDYVVEDSYNTDSLVITAYKNAGDIHKKINTKDGYKMEPGAKVRLCTNNYYAQNKSLYNGACFTVESIVGDKVKLEGYPELIANRNDHVELAHCITVIREQGRTESGKIVVYTENMNMNQLYTAITRVRTLDNLEIVHRGPDTFKWISEGSVQKKNPKKQRTIEKIQIGGDHYIVKWGKKDNDEEEFIRKRSVHNSIYEKEIIKTVKKVYGVSSNDVIREYNDFYVIFRNGVEDKSSRRKYGGKVYNRNKKFYSGYENGTIITKEMAYNSCSEIL